MPFDKIVFILTDCSAFDHVLLSVSTFRIRLSSGSVFGTTVRHFLKAMVVILKRLELHKPIQKTLNLCGHMSGHFQRNI